MTKDEKMRTAIWLAGVYREASRIAEVLDPKLKHEHPIANEMDRIASASKRAHYELIGTFPAL
jgi:hypothetical protein